ncbi:MAG: hypothetical protein GW949_08215 [Spirochaetales bacterium]|nr:hypothetical protein [Spirochaetales bacterium]
MSKFTTFRTFFTTNFTPHVSFILFIVILASLAPGLSAQTLATSTPALGPFAQSTQPTLINLADETADTTNPTDAAPYRPTAAEWIRMTGIHRVAGYVALASALGAGITAIAAPNIHPPFAYAALGTALTSSALGAIGYWEYRDIAWPHFLLMGLAEAGFAMNAFGVFEPGSTAHRVTGISSLAAMTAGYIAIRVIFN